MGGDCVSNEACHQRATAHSRANKALELGSTLNILNRVSVKDAEEVLCFSEQVCRGCSPQKRVPASLCSERRFPCPN